LTTLEHAADAYGAFGLVFQLTGSAASVDSSRAAVAEYEFPDWWDSAPDDAQGALVAIAITEFSRAYVREYGDRPTKDEMQYVVDNATDSPNDTILQEMIDALTNPDGAFYKIWYANGLDQFLSLDGV
jgi:hypothetical protein